MTEPTVICPNCKTEFALTESLAAPLVEATRREFEARLVAEREKIAGEEALKARAAIDAELDGKQSEIATLQDQLKQRNEKVAELQKAQAELARQRQELEDAKRELEVTVSERLREERDKISAEAEKKARLALQDDMDARAREMAELQETLGTQRAKLAEAQAAQAELLKKQRELEDAKAEMELNIQKGIQEGLEASARAGAQGGGRGAEPAAGGKPAHDRQHEEADRGFETARGTGLAAIAGRGAGTGARSAARSAVSYGHHRAGAQGRIRRRCGAHGLRSLRQPCGTILWESKRTKTWSDGWLQKLKHDQRAAKAEVAVIVTQTLPKDVDTFDLVEGVWVSSTRCALPLAVSLRQTLIELALLRQTREGQETKMEMVYEYLTGPHFRQRVQAIVEAFATMKDDLAKEKRAIQAQWAKREKQLERVLGATSGMYGDLQGIAGQQFNEIEGLGLLELEAESVEETEE